MRRCARGGRGPSRAAHGSAANAGGIGKDAGGEPAKRPRPHPRTLAFCQGLLDHEPVADRVLGHDLRLDEVLQVAGPAGLRAGA